VRPLDATLGGGQGRLDVPADHGIQRRDLRRPGRGGLGPVVLGRRRTAGWSIRPAPWPPRAACRRPGWPPDRSPWPARGRCPARHRRPAGRGPPARAWPVQAEAPGRALGEVPGQFGDVLAPLAQRRSTMGNTAMRYHRSSRNCPSATMAARSRCVAATIRTSTLIGWLPPTRSSQPSCAMRSSRTCAAGGNSPISSKSSVPPSARSNQPLRVSTAPVNEPRSCRRVASRSTPAGWPRS